MNVHWALGSCVLLCCVSVSGADDVPVATAPISIRIQKAGELIQVPMPDLMHGIARDVTLDITNDSEEHFRGLSPVSSCSCISLKGQTLPDLEPHQQVSLKVVITPPEKTLAHSVKFYGTSSGANEGEKKFKFDLVFMAKVVPPVRLEPVAQVLSPEDRAAGKQISIDVIPAGKNIQLDEKQLMLKSGGFSVVGKQKQADGSIRLQLSPDATDAGTLQTAVLNCGVMYNLADTGRSHLAFPTAFVLEAQHIEVYPNRIELRDGDLRALVGRCIARASQARQRDGATDAPICQFLASPDSDQPLKLRSSRVSTKRVDESEIFMIDLFIDRTEFSQHPSLYLQIKFGQEADTPAVVAVEYREGKSP